MTILKKYLPIGKAVGKLAISRLTGKPIPLYIGLFITERCNLKCIYCFPNSPNRRVEEFTKKEIFEIVDELYSMGTRYITILGGEPLIRDDFDEIVDYITKKRIIVEVGTNGYFTKKRISTLKKLSLVCHSIDGDEFGHDRNRGEGSYRKVIESIEMCLKNGVPVQMRAVFTKNNAFCLPFLANLARSYNTSLGLAEQACVKMEDTNYVMSTVELRDFWKRVKNYKLLGYPIDKSIDLIENIIKFPTDIDVNKIFMKGERLPDNFKYPLCHLSNGYGFLDCDGFMYPCAALFGKYGLNIRKVGIRGAWNHLQKRECVLCRQSIQDLKSYFFAGDFSAMMVAAKNFLRK